MYELAILNYQVCYDTIYIYAIHSNEKIPI